MRKIELIVRPSKLEAVKQVLAHEWIAGLTVTEVQGLDGRGGHSEIHRGAEYAVDVVASVKVEVVVPDPLAPRVIYEVERLVRTGGIDDGKIFVSAVQEAVRVRNGERGEAAL